MVLSHVSVIATLQQAESKHVNVSYWPQVPVYFCTSMGHIKHVKGPYHGYGSYKLS